MLRGKAAPSIITGLTPGRPSEANCKGPLLRHSLGEVQYLASALYQGKRDCILAVVGSYLTHSIQSQTRQRYSLRS